ncbi:hypothetical protein JCM16358_20570 [Halanaerocella petrolearia]
MSEQFYKFLSNQIVNFFEGIEVKNGERFDIQFEKKEQVKRLYEALGEEANIEEFIYEGNDSSYQTYYILVKGIKVIVSATIADVTIDFLTFLRNQVGTDGKFKDTAILFIHNTNLDSIIKGSGDFYKEGMPFHWKSIESVIEEEIEAKNLNKADRIVVNFILSKIEKNNLEDETSLFAYKEILEVLNQGNISKDKYKSFGLFYDNGLDTFSEKEALERLEENYNLFYQVSNIHQYGNPDQELEKTFDDEGVNLLRQKDWTKVNYKKVKNSIENKKSITPLKYIENTKKETLEGCVYWEKPKGNTKAQARTRNIIVFNPDKEEEINLFFQFDDYLKKSCISYTPKSNIIATPSGKKLKVTIIPEKNQTTFKKVLYNYKGRKNYAFRIAIVEAKTDLLESIKTTYSLPASPRKSYIEVKSEEENLVINSNGSTEKKIIIDQEKCDIKISNSEEKLILEKDTDVLSEIEEIQVDLKYIDTFISLVLEQEVERPKPLTGNKVWKLKREKQKDFEYDFENKKLIQGNQQYFARDEFRSNLELEKQMIEKGALFYKKSFEELEEQELEIDIRVEKTYNKLIDYYHINQLLPSLAYYDEELLDLSKKYVKSYLEVISEIPEGEPLDHSQKNLIKLGSIEEKEGAKEIIFTPLHPLNVSYQILANNILGKQEVNKNILKRLKPINLLPYIQNDCQKLYKAIEQHHSPEWNYYVNDNLTRYNGSKEFVSKLVSDKISEFINHFSYLFTIKSESPIKINLINMGDCKEILQGIFEYYSKKLKEVKMEEIIPMDIYIYGNDSGTNVFEELSLYTDIENIKEKFEINLASKNYDEVDLLNLFRNKVSVYTKDLFDEEFEYSHITFYQMKDNVKDTYRKMDDIKTGASLDGLVSGIPSVHVQNSYCTGFGTKYIGEEKNILLETAIKLNALARTANNMNPYNEEESIITVISEEKKQDLDKIYDSSHWVSFIEPKVDLSFFKNDAKFKDLLIIHYSDQYTSSSGYDAITVTRRSKQYQNIIEEFLEEKDIENVQEHSPDIINCFNAINGDWLLRLISKKSHFPREKLSILSAVKISLAYFYHPDIIWVPVSLEEILRVSGATGLKTNEGLFQKSKKGSYSDDLLLIGFEINDNQIKVHYYPIEVKIGLNRSNVVRKAKKQAKQTKDLLNINLQGNKFINKFYRNFMMQLALISAEKMKLYGIWEEQNWDLIIDNDVREKILNDNYVISNDLDSLIQKQAVISFKKETHFRNTKIEDEVLILEFTEEDGYKNIVSSIEDLKNNFLPLQSDFNKSDLLRNIYKNSSIKATQEQEGEKIEDIEESEESYSKENQAKNKPKVENCTSNDKPMEVIFGYDEYNNPIKWYPTSTDKVMHTNTGIIGTMGTGKTQFTKSMVTQLYKNSKYNLNGTEIGILIFDYKGDYVKGDFKKATDATVYKLYNLPYNPLALYEPKISKALLPLHTASNLTESISQAFNLGNVQEQILEESIIEAYENKGISPNDKETWDKKPPTLHDVYDIYVNRDDVKVDKLHRALTKLTRFHIFQPNAEKTKPLYELIDGVTVIDLSGYDESIQNLVVAITLDTFYNQMQMKGHSTIQGDFREITKMILVDEADNFLKNDFTSLKKILKEGREYGVGTILSTQFLDHFSTSNNDYSNYIWSWVVHNVSDIKKNDVKFIFNTQSKGEEENIITKIKQLEKHYSIVHLGKEKHPIHINDLAFWQLNNDIEVRFGE